MRHRVSKKKLNRTTDHRRALLKNLSVSLILEGHVQTTLAKAKFFKPYVEKLVTKAKGAQDLHNITLVTSKLGSEAATKKLFSDIATNYTDRKGGYTKITKLGFRSGDKAPMAKIEWVSKETK